MKTIENDIRIMQIKIIGYVCIYCVLLLSILSFFALKMGMLYGLAVLILHLSSASIARYKRCCRSFKEKELYVFFRLAFFGNIVFQQY